MSVPNPIVLESNWRKSSFQTRSTEGCLEEFRKIPMSKSLLNFLVQISKALVNSKIKFLIQKSFFFISARLPLPAHSAFGPAGPAGPSPPAAGSQLCKNMFSSLIHAFPSRRHLSIHPLTHGPHLSVSSSPPHRLTPVVSPPRRRSPRHPLRASDAAEPLPPPITPPFNPLQIEP
jgi:hypothetical protein